MSFSIKKIAAVTGARGLVGLSIVESLLKIGWGVRILTRSNVSYDNPEVQVVVADINNENRLKTFLHGVDAVFHCAGEINNENLMYATNVNGTKCLLRILKESNISYFCHVSSAGVIGQTNELNITENTVCNPIGVYEKTKYESEKLVLKANLPMSVVILRPTNVVSLNKPGVFIRLPIRNSWKDKLKVLITGKENTHIIHVEDVARAALFFLDSHKVETNIYFISNDDELNTTLGIYNLYMSICNSDKSRMRASLPVIIPHIARSMYRRHSLYGKTRFSSKKIKNKGFSFRFSTEECISLFCACENNTKFSSNYIES